MLLLLHSCSKSHLVTKPATSFSKLNYVLYVFAAICKNFLTGREQKLNFGRKVAFTRLPPNRDLLGLGLS